MRTAAFRRKRTATFRRGQNKEGGFKLILHVAPLGQSKDHAVFAHIVLGDGHELKPLGFLLALREGVRRGGG